MSSSCSNGASSSAQTISYPPSLPSKDEVLDMMPRRTLTEEDFDFVVYKQFREMVKQEDALPPGHIPLIDVEVLRGMLKIMEEQGRNLKDNIAFQVFIERPQVFSETRLKDLSRIKIQDLMIRKRHKGKVLLVRTFCRPVHDLTTGMLVGVEDPAGGVAFVKLFNYAFLLHIPSSDAEAIMPSGTMLAIREPTYSMNRTVPNLPFIKVDSPSDVVFVEYGNPILRNTSWKWLMEKGWNPWPTSGEEWKAKALEHFKAAQWLPAAVCFTNCINIGFEVQVSKLNRSEAYLQIGWNKSALCDAQEALKMGTLSADLNKKTIIRMIKALYALHRYEEITEALELLPNDKAVLNWAIKAKKRIEEHETGIYDWPSLIKAKRSKGRLRSFDLANYSAPIEIKTDANGLRGMYAMRDLKAGELVMVENPLSTVRHKKYPGAGIWMVHVPSRSARNERDNYHLFCETLRRVWEDEHLYAVISSLFSGQKGMELKPFPRPSIDCRPLEHPLKPKVDIDVDMVYLATRFNVYDIGDEMTFYGLPSLLNHACNPNTHRQFFGNVIAVRALRNIKQGEEITIEYIEGTHPYDERRYRLMDIWRFNCACESCRADDGDGFEARKTRRKLLKEMQVIRCKHSAPIKHQVSSATLQSFRRLAAEGKKLCDAILRTYHAGHDSVKFEFAEALEIHTNTVNFLAFSSPRHDPASYKETLELKFEILALRGLKVTDRTIAGAIPGGKKGKKRTLPVDTSGFSEHAMCSQTVLQISHIFKELGDMERSKRWFDTAVWMERIFYGGDIETFKARQTVLSTMGLTMHY